MEHPSKDRVIERGEGEGGFAQWNDISLEVPGVGTVVFADLTVSEGVFEIPILNVFLNTEEGNIAEGVAFIDQNVFGVDKKLTTATLSPVTMQLFVSDEFGNFIETTEITIQATWEGTGDTLKQRFIQHSSSDNFKVHFKQTHLSTQATAEGSINGANLGTTNAAELFAFKQVRMEVSESIIN